MNSQDTVLSNITCLFISYLEGCLITFILHIVHNMAETLLILQYRQYGNNFTNFTHSPMSLYYPYQQVRHIILWGNPSNILQVHGVKILPASIPAAS